MRPTAHPGTHPPQEPLASRQANGKALLLPSTATHCGTQNDKAVRVPMLLPERQHLLQREL